MPPLLVAGHLRQLPHTAAPAAEVIDVDAEKNAVPVILPAPVYNSLTGDVRVVGGDDQSRRWEGAGETSFIYPIGV